MVNDIPVIPASDERVTALNAGRPENVSVRNVFRCGASVKPVFVDVESSAARTVRRAASSPIAALMLASRYCADVKGAMRSLTWRLATTVGRAASTAAASTAGASTGVVDSSTCGSLSGCVGSTGVDSSAAISST